jgi:hypothetical protein
MGELSLEKTNFLTKVWKLLFAGILVSEFVVLLKLIL